MKVFTVRDAEVAMQSNGILGKKLYARAELAIVHMDLEPGAVVAPHATTFDAQFFVIEGRGVITIGDETVEVGPGTLVESPKGLAHGVRNSGSGSLKLLVLKTPNPDRA